MKFLRLIRFILQAILFILLLVLAIDNMQTVEVNFFGIYYLKLPLIITLAIFTAAGFIFGIATSYINKLTTKTSKNNLPQKDLKPQHPDHIL
jgi:uncharacterized integral membrane protein